MATSYILRRNGKSVACSTCGQTGLEWVSVDPSKFTGAWDAASPKVKGWKYVPYGTDDLSGTVHSLRPETCTGGKIAPAAASVAAPAVPNTRLDALEADVQMLKRGVDSANAAIDNVAQTIGDVIAKVDAIKIDAAVGKRLDAIEAEVKALGAVKPISISVNNRPAINVGRQHYMFANLVAAISAIGTTGVVFLQGERGSGKSHVIKPLAEALAYNLDSDVYKFEFNPDTSAVDVFGFKSATGGYAATGFREAYVKRSLVFVDELPRAMPDAVSALNSITDGTVAGFPDGLQQRHAENIVFAAGNTAGRGASDDYEGNKLDAATLSRLVYIPWDTDWALMGELNGFKLKGRPQPFPDPGAPRQPAEYADWGEYVLKVINIMQSLGIKSSASARAIQNGAKMLAAGIDRGLVEYATLFGHMSEQDADTVKAAL